MITLNMSISRSKESYLYFFGVLESNGVDLISDKPENLIKNVVKYWLKVNPIVSFE